jgi:small subunit ribosomal protein S16
MAIQWLQAPQAQCFAALAGATPKATPRARSVARLAEEEDAAEEPEEEEEPVYVRPDLPVPRYRGPAKYLQMSDYTQRKRLNKFGNQFRLKLSPFGSGAKTFRIVATTDKKFALHSDKYFEKVGWWMPHKELDDAQFMRIKCDRVVHWLRKGAQPTDQVANLLDMVGLIRRTGKFSLRGEWEWRVPVDSGPEAPEGWSYDGPHLVDWGNKPYWNPKWEKARRSFVEKPLIERHGFIGYQKIPLDEDIAAEPLTDSGLFNAFPNVRIPGFVEPAQN